MNCVEVDGAGWRWVHGLVIPFFYEHFQIFTILFAFKMISFTDISRILLKFI